MKKILLILVLINYAVVGFAMQKCVLQAVRSVAPVALASGQAGRQAAGCNLFKRTQTLFDKNPMHQGKNMQRQSAQNMNDLIGAIYRRDMLDLKRLIESWRLTSNVVDERSLNLNPLFVAIHIKDMLIVQCLVEHGFSVNTCADNGVTLLMMAVQMGDVAITKYLIEQGANVNAQNSVGKTVLMVAAGSGNLKMVRLLLEQGADPRLKSNSGHDARQYALKKKHLEVVKELIEHMINHK